MKLSNWREHLTCLVSNIISFIGSVLLSISTSSFVYVSSNLPSDEWILLLFCGDNSLAGFNVEEGNEVGLKEGSCVGSFDRFLQGTVVGFNEGDVIGLFGGLDEK